MYLRKGTSKKIVKYFPTGETYWLNNGRIYPAVLVGYVWFVKKNESLRMTSRKYFDIVPTKQIIIKWV
jgi:hypothetical protein